MLGDTHSIASALTVLASDYTTAGTDVFHVGDVGIGFRHEDKEVRELNILNKVCVAKDIRLFAIRGNHDDPAKWTREGKMKGHDDRKNIILVPDYTAIEFPCGKRALAVGGGISVDRYSRVPELSYWYDEITERYVGDLPEFDFVFAHDAPSDFNSPTISLHKNFPTAVKNDPSLIEDAKSQRDVMDYIKRETKCRVWVGGHYHNSEDTKVRGFRYRCLDVRELWDFIANEF